MIARIVFMGLYSARLRMTKDISTARPAGSTQRDFSATLLLHVTSGADAAHCLRPISSIRPGTHNGGEKPKPGGEGTKISSISS